MSGRELQVARPSVQIATEAERWLALSELTDSRSALTGLKPALSQLGPRLTENVSDGTVHTKATSHRQRRAGVPRTLTVPR